MAEGAKKFVFVGGEHRSGTTLVARTLAQHPWVSGLAGTGVIEDEGQHIQSVYRTDEAYGGPGEWAFHPRAHMDELPRDLRSEARERLLREWSRYWDMSKPVLLEKSPANLTKMRFLLSLFPEARFVVVIRHPVASASAIKERGWGRPGRLPPWSWLPMSMLRPLRSHRLIEHWLLTYERFLADATFVPEDRILLLRYERFVKDSNAEVARMCHFLGLPAHDFSADLDPTINARYFLGWSGSSHNWLKQRYRRLIVDRFEARVQAFGYSLADPASEVDPAPDVLALSQTFS